MYFQIFTGVNTNNNANENDTPRSKSGERKRLSSQSTSASSNSTTWQASLPGKHKRKSRRVPDGKLIVLKELGPDGLFSKIDEEQNEQTELSEGIDIQPHLTASSKLNEGKNGDVRQSRVPTAGLNIRYTCTYCIINNPQLIFLILDEKKIIQIWSAKVKFHICLNVFIFE